MHMGLLSAHVHLHVRPAEAREEDGRCVHLYKRVFVSA